MDIIHIIISRAARLLAALTLTAAPLTAAAFSTDTYAASSVLAQDRWVKVSVSQTGIHLITDSQLRQWGFSDPAKVHVYGYGGQRISDALTLANYTDDLPQVQSLRTSRGLFFYAQGTTTWRTAVSSRYYPTNNPFSSVGYYFLSDRETTDREIEDLERGVSSADLATSFNERVSHEIDQYSPGLTGHYLLGEDFRYTPSQTFTFDLTDRVDDTSVWMQTNFFSKTSVSSSRLTFTVNGTTLAYASGDDIISTDTSTSYNFGAEGTIRKTFDMSGSKLSLGISHSSSVSILAARLNFIAINYARALKMRDGHLQFTLTTPGMKIDGATAETHVWDVTKPLDIKALATQADGSSTVTCINQYTGSRDYVAWNESASYPTVTFTGNVANQDLHAIETPDMVIFTISTWAAQAQRLADYHAQADGLKTIVVDQEQVFNEFASGVPDVNAFRRMLKMLWDRGQAAGTPPAYALMMGRGFFDHRRLTSEGKSVTYQSMPVWQTDGGTSDNSSYTGDAILGFLNDGSGVTTTTDKMSIAIGRLPVRSTQSAKEAVDKILGHIQAAPQGEWKNRVLLIADDEDNAVHLDQSEHVAAIMADSIPGSLLINRVYVDAYERVGGESPGAQDDMLRLLNEGTMWWNFIGHASTNSWTHEKILTTTQINDLYLRRLPILYAATCDFMRWDNNSSSGAEMLFALNDGGIVAGISTTRPVYITNNADMSRAVAFNMLNRDADGNFGTIGQLYKNAINGINKSDSNRLRYVLLGDPAMKITIPSNNIKIEKVNGKTLDPDNPPELMARQKVTIEGSIYDGNGLAQLNDFNGTVTMSLYDAEYSTTTLGNGDNAKNVRITTFEQHGARLLTTTATVTDGHFSAELIMPLDIADNYRPATLNMYACDPSTSAEAVGTERGLYVYGLDNDAEDDEEPPSIKTFYLNHPSFTNGSRVNSSPMVIADITDNQAINLSTSGIGHSISLVLDDNVSYSDVANYFTPGSSQGEGSLAYQLEGLREGTHTLRLRVWDSAGNWAQSTIDFEVDAEASPTIFDVYSDANPATAQANFYVSHDRPDTKATVTITVYNMLGAEVWSSATTGRSDMYLSSPVTWDLTDKGGHRVGRGIYLYRATIATSDGLEASSVKKIAVTGR